MLRLFMFYQNFFLKHPYIIKKIMTIFKFQSDNIFTCRVIAFKLRDHNIQNLI